MGGAETAKMLKCDFREKRTQSNKIFGKKVATGERSSAEIDRYLSLSPYYCTADRRRCQRHSPL